MRDDEKRMRQITHMFSEITGKRPKEAKQIILQTETGIAISENNQTALYEQQTENLYSIAMELSENPEYRELAKLFSEEKIIQSMNCLKDLQRPEAVFVDENNTVGKIITSKTNNKLLKERQKKVLASKKQNQMMGRRVQNAD